MLTMIIQKELLVNILSLRFMIGLLVVILMMGLIGYVLAEDYTFRQQTYISNLLRHQEALGKFKVYSTIETVVDIPPSPLSVFSRGTKDLPLSVRISPYEVPSLIAGEEASSPIRLGGESSRPFNPLLRIFSSIDLTFVISMILSLFAILLVFDSFSGEREQGTLRLMMSTSAGRVRLLVGKFTGALITMAIPLTVGFLEILLIWNLYPQFGVGAPTWTGTALIYLFSLVFLAGFLALGLLISLFSKESSTGLMYLLLAWVMVAVVIPEGIGYLAEYYHPRESTKDLMTGADKQFQESLKKIPPELSAIHWMWGSMGDEGGEEMLGISREDAANRVEYHKLAFPLKLENVESRARGLDDYTQRLNHWKDGRDALLRTSFCVLYDNIVTAIAGTDVESYEANLRKARRYRETLVEYLRPKAATAEWFTRVLEHPEMEPTEANRKLWKQLRAKEGPEALYKIFTWDNVKPLDVGSMPMPMLEFSGTLDRLSRVLPDISILFATTGCFLLLACWRVKHYKIT